jgi:hypothetical protein
MSRSRPQQHYDHRLVQLVQRTSDITQATGCGVPPSTARGWLSRESIQVVTHPAFDPAEYDLRVRLLRLESRLARLNALLRIVLSLLRMLRPDFTCISFSNSLIEAWWRSLEHNWLFLHPLDTTATVRREGAFYVEEHNTTLPHAAFRGQTPDEVYFGKGDEIPDRLAEARAEARERRMEANRARQCTVCA